MQNPVLNLTKFGQQFYTNLEPVGIVIQEIEGIRGKRPARTLI